MNSKSVIVLHGIGLSPWHTALIAKSLSAEYHVHNLYYPSRSYPLEDLVEVFRKNLEQRKIADTPTHFVGYSMGGILSRAYLRAYPPKEAIRVVQVGSPNAGSEVADYFKNWPLYRFLFGPAGAQLTTKSKYLEDLRHQEGNYELGSIAGRFDYDPVGKLCIPSPNDGKVSIASTRTFSMKDHIIVPSSHFYMPYSPHVRSQIKAFLNTGEFQHPTL